MPKKSFLILFVFCSLIGIASIRSTRAYLLDREFSGANNFLAATLLLSLKNPADIPFTSPLFSIADMKPGDVDTKTLRIKNDGSIPFQYQLWFTKNSGEDTLCTALQLSLTKNGVTLYNGNLSGFSFHSPFSVMNGSYDDLILSLSLANTDSSIQTKSCNFDIHIKSSQEGTSGSWGLSNEKILGNTVTSGTWITTLLSKISLAPELTLTLSSDKKYVSFSALHISNFEKLSYVITYDADTKVEGIMGNILLGGIDTYTKDGLFLGSCSSGGTCTPHTGVKNLKLQVKLTDKDGNDTILEKTL